MGYTFLGAAVGGMLGRAFLGVVGEVVLAVVVGVIAHEINRMAEGETDRGEI